MKFKKNKKQYILKNKDIPILTFDYEKIVKILSDVEIPSYKIKHIKILEPNLLPAGYPDTVDSNKLKKWIEHRGIPKNRRNRDHILKLNSILNEEQLNNNFMNYIDISYGLSLNDSYWIIPDDGNEYKWENYNLYKNKFSEVRSLIALGILDSIDSDKIRLSPEYTTHGMLAKCWTIINNEVVLLKKSSNHYDREAFAEYYMTQVAEIMGFDHVKYDVINYHNNIVSLCPIFTTEDIGFIPIHYCMDPKDTLKEEAKLLESIVKIYGKEKLEDLMIFDSLIYNTDRHLGNFGMLVDNNTRKLLGPAPIFDNGNSILSFLDDETSLEVISSYYISRFNLSFDLLTEFFVQERHREGLEKLKDFKFKRHKEHNLAESLLEKGEKFISERAKIALNKLEKKLEK